MSFRSIRIFNYALVLLLSVTAFAQSQPAKPLTLVMPEGPGRILYPSTSEWTIVLFNLYDNGTRPVLEVKNHADINVSYILFPNNTGTPTAQGCRDAVVDPLIRGLSNSGTIKNDRKETYTSTSGTPIVTRSYFVESMASAPVHQQNLFGFFGDASTCAEIHISKSLYKPADEALMKTVLDHFHYEASYQPTTEDYFILGSIFFSKLSNPKNAAPYYQRAFDSLPSGPPADEKSLILRRVLVDQLVMSYGMTGDLKQSRAVANKAITEDPDYPLNYYNLACADAEQGKTADAKLHLQQAFDRKANTLPGETLPDPTKDDSILKLKEDKTFWSFAESLSTSK
jgi:tetratricopeptide (TPR) repeat protein